MKYIIDTDKHMSPFDGIVMTTLGCLEDADMALEDAYQRGFEDGKAQRTYDDKIEVGDEVYCKDDDVSDSGVVTWVGKDSVYAMWQDGSAGEVQKDELIKTGRHFDISSILEDMRHD